MKTKTLQVCMSEVEYASVRDAARRAGIPVSQFAAAAVLRGMRPEFKPEQTIVLESIGNFRQIFCEAMELSLVGKLTVQRFRSIVERRAA